MLDDIDLCQHMGYVVLSLFDVLVMNMIIRIPFAIDELNKCLQRTFRSG